MGTFVGVPHEQVFQFEGFTLDVTRRTLRAADRDIELRPRSFDVLCCLLRHGGQLVTKDEVLRNVWPGITVSDESLTRCVSDIRLSLGDREQRIVKTVPGRGYLLAVPVLQMVAENGLAQFAGAARNTPTSPDRPSIAVLPFTSMSASPDQEVFSDGITEDITTALCRLKGFFVIARNTMFTYKARPVDVRMI